MRAQAYHEHLRVQPYLTDDSSHVQVEVAYSSFTYLLTYILNKPSLSLNRIHLLEA